MKMFFTRARIVLWLLIVALAVSLNACTTMENEGGKMELNLAVTDTYDLAAMGFSLVSVDGKAVSARGNTIEAVSEGTAEVTISDAEKQYTFGVRVYPDAKTLGNQYPVDRGMFQGKNVIVLGDSIVYGWICEPGVTIDHNATYFAQLCGYLGAATDPADLTECNLSQGGTTLVIDNEYGISGLNRIEKTEPFLEESVMRDPYRAFLTADLCVIAHGTNDFSRGVMAECLPGSVFSDTPTERWQVNSFRGGLYYAIGKIREINPNIKIIVSSPAIWKADGQLMQYTPDRLSVLHTASGATIQDYVRVMKAVCQEQGAILVDFSNVFTYDNFCETQSRTWTCDGLHPTSAGHQLMFEAMIKQLTQSGNIYGEAAE